MWFFFFFPPLHLAFAVGRDKEKVLCTKKYLEAVGMLRDFKNSSQDPDFTQVRNYSFHSFSCALPYFNITVVSFFKKLKLIKVTPPSDPLTLSVQLSYSTEF